MGRNKIKPGPKVVTTNQGRVRSANNNCSQCKTYAERLEQSALREMRLREQIMEVRSRMGMPVAFRRQHA